MQFLSRTFSEGSQALCLSRRKCWVIQSSTGWISVPWDVIPTLSDKAEFDKARVGRESG